MSLHRLLERAGRSSARVLLAGGTPELLGRADARLRAAGVGSRVVGDADLRPEGHPQLEAVAALLRSRRPEQVRDAIHALDLASDPLYFALGLAGLGEAEAVLAGPDIPVVALVAAAEWLLGRPAGEGAVHSAYWLMLPDGRLIAFADAALPSSTDPGAQGRLGDVVARIHARLGTGPPTVALLPGFRGDENVLIFPDGVMGQVARSVTQHLAGAALLGPLLLGLPVVVGGVNRGAEEDELVGTAAAIVLAAGRGGT